MSSLVLLKPDACANGLAKQFFQVFNQHYEIGDWRVRTMDRELCRKHYAEHVEKPFYLGLEDFMVSGPLMALFVLGDVIQIRVHALALRERFRFLTENPRNLIHASDGPEAAHRELKLWFGPPYRSFDLDKGEAVTTYGPR